VCQDDDGTSSYRVERTEQKHGVMSAETENGVVASDHHKRLQRQTAALIYTIFR